MYSTVQREARGSLWRRRMWYLALSLADFYVMMAVAVVPNTVVSYSCFSNSQSQFFPLGIYAHEFPHTLKT